MNLDSTFPLSEVVVTHRLRERKARAHDFNREVESAHFLAKQLANLTGDFLKMTTEHGLQLLNAGTVGVSILEHIEGEETFVCYAASGVHSQVQGWLTPRHHSPCGICIESGEPALFTNVEKYFGYFSELSPEVSEELVVPIFSAEGKILGTLWVAHHDKLKQFDAHDVRIAELLACQVSTFLRLHPKIEKPKTSHGGSLKAYVEQASKQTVQDQRKWLEAVLDGLPVGMVMVEPGSGDYIFSNRVAKKFFGTTVPVENNTEASRASIGVFDLMGNPLSTDQFPSFRAAKGEKLDNEQVICDTPNGRLYISCFSDVLPAMYGHQETVVVPFIDVTREKIAAKELSESQRRLQSLFQQAPVPICIMEGSGHKFVLMNPHYSQLIGGREVVGKTVREALPELEGQGFFELLDQVYASGNAHYGVEMQANIQGTDGKLREAYFNFVYKPMFNGAGAVIGIMAVATDVTTQVISRRIVQESELALRELADAMPQIVWAANPQGLLYYTNKGWTEYSGSSDPTQWLNFVHESDVERTKETWGASVRSGDPYQVEFRIKKAGTQEYRWHLVRARAVKNEVGEITRWYGTCTDIHEQRQIQTELLKAKNQADTASQLKTAFLANMSHEIRTPLGAILGFTELLRSPDLSDEEREQYLGVVDRNGKALTRLIDDILDLSKVEAGRLDIELVSFSLRELIDETVQLFEEASQSKGLFLRTVGDIPAFIHSDPTRIRQILINIIGNAIKFTNRGGITIAVKKHSALGKEVVSIEVTDTGVGMTADQARHLFQPFSQADNSTSRRFGGTGLGLALSRRLARALGGDVLIAECGLKQGCTFVIQISAQLASPTSDQTRAAPKVSAPSKKKRLTGLHLLVVDDAPDNRMLMNYMLKNEGATVDEACDGREGVDKALALDYDAVLMDIQMPGMDGYESIGLLRRKDYIKPVIALTAHAMKEERDRSLASGFDDHVTKPIQRDVLVESILKHALKSSNTINLEM